MQYNISDTARQTILIEWQKKETKNSSYCINQEDSKAEEDLVKDGTIM
jgi:hypothetical protein